MMILPVCIGAVQFFQVLGIPSQLAVELEVQVLASVTGTASASVTTSNLLVLV